MLHQTKSNLFQILSQYQWNPIPIKRTFCSPNWHWEFIKDNGAASIKADFQLPSIMRYVSIGSERDVLQIQDFAEIPSYRFSSIYFNNVPANSLNNGLGKFVEGCFLKWNWTFSFLLFSSISVNPLFLFLVYLIWSMFISICFISPFSNLSSFIFSLWFHKYDPWVRSILVENRK